EIKGKAGDSLRAGLADVLRNYELNRLVDDLELPLAPADLAWHGWDREAVHQVFDTLQFRVLRDRLYQYLEAVEPEAEAGFDLAGEVLAPGAVAGWLATHAPPGAPARVAGAGPGGRGGGGHLGPGYGRADRRRPRHRRRPRRLVRPDGPRRRRRRGGGRVAGRRGPAQDAARQQTGAARVRGARLGAARR